MTNDAVEKENWFSPAEYARRLAAVRRQMAAREVDALVILAPADCYYVTGHHSLDSWEFRAAVVKHDRDPALLLYQFERGRFMASSWLAEAKYYDAHDDPLAKLIELLRAMNLGESRIGIELHVTLGLSGLQRLQSELPNATLVSTDRLVARIRLLKSSEELACIVRAAELTNIGVKAARAAIVEGNTDCDIGAAAAGAMTRAGSHNFIMPPIIAVGPRSGLAHSEHNSRTIRRGDAVFIELSGCWRHYPAPLMYTTVAGAEPSALWKELRDVAHDVADAILATARPGAVASDVATAARRAMVSIEDRVQFHFNFGYSIGASFPPHWLEESAFYIRQTNHEPLAAGMVFHSALTMRVLGQFAAGTSRTIEITDSGARALTGARNGENDDG